MAHRNKITLSILALICLLVILVMVDNIELLGPYPDDLGGVLHAKRVLDNTTPDRPGTIEVFNHVLPLNSYYNGMTDVYFFMIPLGSILGLEYSTVRIYGIVIVLLATIFTFLLGKTLFNEKVGLISASLFAFLPATIFYGMLPLWTKFSLVFWFIPSLYFLVEWRKTGKIRFMIIAFVFLGIGLSTKINFVWVIVALAITFLIFRPKIIRSIKNLVIMGISMIAGSTILVISFLSRPTYFLGTLFLSAETTPVGHSNLDFSSNVAMRFSNFFQLMDGSSLMFLGAQHSNILFVYFLIISIIGIFLLRLKFYNRFFKKSLFLILMLGIMIVISSGTVTLLNVAQLVILLPLAPLIMGAFIVTLSDRISKKTNNEIFSLPIIFGLTIFLLVSNFMVIDSYKSDLERTGGVGLFSTIYYDIADYLKENNMNQLVALDWGIGNSIYVSSNYELRPAVAILYNTSNFQVDKYKQTVEESLMDPDTVYIKHPKDVPIQGSWDLFVEVLEKHDKKPVLIKTFYSWNEKDLFYLYKAE